MDADGGRGVRRVCRSCSSGVTWGVPAMWSACVAEIRMLGDKRPGCLRRRAALEKVRIGVIGVGMGRNHAVRYRECPEADLVALCDQNPERLAKVQGETGARKTYTQI